MSKVPRARLLEGLSCALLAGLSACTSGGGKPGSDAGADAATSPRLAREELLKPESCAGCHPVQYREWSGSMHAYAAEDPVFIAMNARGQEETNGELGDFCVRCHAPMAVLEGETKDGLNLDTLPDELKGVTCYFCHNAVEIAADHNGSITLANDTTMRGSFRAPDAVDPGVHGVAYSALHDRNNTESSALCGACHDVVTPKGVHMERTFKEYKESLFSTFGPRFDTCQGCHMDGGRRGKAAEVPGLALPERTIHEHLWPGVDVALTDFPHREAQRLAVECALANSAKVLELRADPRGQFTVDLETSAGHAQPSGTAHDRRMWLEFIAYNAADEIVYQSGVIADDELEEKPEGSVTDPRVDPKPWMFRDRIYDAAGHEVHMFWEAEKSAAHVEGYESYLLPPLVIQNVPHVRTRIFRVPSGLPARVTVQLRMRPIGRDILEDLVRSEDLDPKFLADNPTFTLYGTVMEWKRADGFGPITAVKPIPIDCPDGYRCLLDPSGEACPESND